MPSHGPGLSNNTMEILLASGNAGKLVEIGEMTAHLPVNWKSLKSLVDFTMPEETGVTFEENALLKAGAAAARSGLITLAEDSGLCVDALDGDPGVFSARFAGDHGNNQANNDKLVHVLRGIRREERGAHYACVMALVFPDTLRVNSEHLPDGSRIVRESPFLPKGFHGWVTAGKVVGEILEEPRGEGGFGYDPLFYYPPFGVTFAESTPEAKNQVSHRAQAVGRLVSWLSSEPFSS